MRIVEPYHPVVRSGAHPEATTAFGWFMDARPDAAQRAVDRLDVDAAMAAMTAAADMAIALGRRLNQLRAQALPKRASTVCAYCGNPDCAERWQHDRWNEANEETIWRKATK